MQLLTIFQHFCNCCEFTKTQTQIFNSRSRKCTFK